MSNERFFEFKWFDGQIPLFSTFLKEYSGKDNLKFLEIGSFEGYSTCWMLDNILTGKDCSITCVDSWSGGQEHSKINMSEIEKRFLINIENAKSKVEIKKGLSKDVLISLRDKLNYYDFIYIDGGHTAKDVIEDLILSFDLLKSNGIMAMDDFLWGGSLDVGNQQLDHMRPEYSIRLFLLAYQNELECFHLGGQVWIRKK